MSGPQLAALPFGLFSGPATTSTRAMLVLSDMPSSCKIGHRVQLSPFSCPLPLGRVHAVVNTSQYHYQNQHLRLRRLVTPPALSASACRLYFCILLEDFSAREANFLSSYNAPGVVGPTGRGGHEKNEGRQQALLASLQICKAP